MDMQAYVLGLVEKLVVVHQHELDSLMPPLLQMLAQCQYSREDSQDGILQLISSKDQLREEGHIKIVRLETVDISSYPDWVLEKDLYFFAQLFRQNFQDHLHPDESKVLRAVNFVSAVSQLEVEGYRRLLLPTVFEWTTGIPEKDYTIFAMAAPLSEDEEARRYSLSELLGMRDSLSVINCPVNKIFHPSTIGNRLAHLATILRIPQEAYTNPETFFCATKNLIEKQKKNKSNQQLSHRREDSTTSQSFEEDIAEHTTLPSQSRHSQRSIEWHFRRRDSSHSSQPYSAPSSIAAQQAENFQRFYRAVVSPSHVRVTAGGRIIPNIRASAIPNFDWNPEKLLSDQGKSECELDTSAPASWLQAICKLPQQIISEQNQMSRPREAVAHHEGSLPQVTAAMRDRNLTTATNDTTHKISSIPQNFDQVQISHPSQFDHSKPFLFNGHLVYPAPAGFQPPENSQPLPITILGNPNFIHPGPRPMPLPGGSPLGFLPAGHHLPMMLPNGAPAVYPQVPMLLPNGASTGFETSHFAPYPAMFMLPPQYITEQDMAVAHLSKAKESPAGNHSTSPALSDHMLSISGVRVPNAGLSRPDRLPTEESPAKANTPVQNQVVSKSKLSAAAAMAPPFKPRTQATPTPATQPITQSEFARTSRYEDTQTGIAVLMDWKQSNDASSSVTVTALPPSSLKTQTQYSSHNFALNQHHTTDHHAETLKSDRTFHGKSESLSSLAMEPIISSNAVPYLVGTPPHGMRVADVQSGDLTYPRPLTDEEIRARYLYWGKAPRSVQKGLPKFDGKDFYPPSPIKEMAGMANNSPMVSTDYSIHDQTNNRISTPDFSKLFTHRTNSGFRPPPTPVMDSNLQSDVPVSPILFKPRQMTYPPPSPRQSTYPIDSITYPNMSAKFSGPRSRDLNFKSKSPATATTAQNDSHGLPEFSRLFLSPSPIRQNELEPQMGLQGQSSSRGFITPKHSSPSEVRSVDSWGLPSHSPQWHVQENDVLNTADRAKLEVKNISSTVENTLIQDVLARQPAGTFAERIASVSNTDQQTQFLQNMLRNTAQAAPALSGTVSVTTAQGYLPQYRGTAAASLAPTVSNVMSSDRGREYGIAKEVNSSITPVMSPNFLPENRPFNRHRHHRPSLESMGAQEYMRSIARKADEDDKALAQGWNANTTGKGPIMGSDW